MVRALPYAAVAVGAGFILRKTLRIPFSDCDHKTASAFLHLGAYKGKVVWITGASSGIGKELAIQLARQGAKLIISARRESVLQEVKSSLAAPADDVVVLPLDLEDLDSLPGRVEQAISSFGRVDVMINNGGISTRALGRKTGFEIDMKLMRVDYLSAVVIAKQLLPKMIENREGMFINISSLAGKFGSPLRTAYCAAKFALLGHFDALRCEEAGQKSGIRVCNVCPGSISTEVSKNALTEDGTAFGVTDQNIGNGISVERCADRILAGAHAGVRELWIAKGPELMAAYLAQYAPDTAKGVLEKMSQKIIQGTLVSNRSKL